MKRVSFIQNNNVQIDLFADESKFVTKVLNNSTNEVTEEEHFDVDHLINNLLTYGINYHTIMSLLEDELDEKSFSKDYKELEKWCKENIKKKHLDTTCIYESFNLYWLRDERFIKNKYLKKLKVNR